MLQQFTLHNVKWQTTTE